MPAKSKRQANFFKLVRAVQDKKVPASNVSNTLRKTAKSISKKAASDFTKMTEMYLKEEDGDDNFVSKNAELVIKDADEFNGILNTPDYLGSNFTSDELDTVDICKSSPSKKSATEVRYSGTDNLSSKNKLLILRKKDNSYIAFFSSLPPTELNNIEASVDVNSTDDGKTADVNEKKEKVLIHISKQIKNGVQDLSLLGNFINFLLTKYQL